jgi:hypothetical protein
MKTIYVPGVGDDMIRLDIMNDAAVRDDDICGLCGKPGADKVPHPVYWPGEREPGTPYVHEDCEDEECARAHGELSDAERDAYLRSL